VTISASPGFLREAWRSSAACSTISCSVYSAWRADVSRQSVVRRPIRSGAKRREKRSRGRSIPFTKQSGEPVPEPGWAATAPSSPARASAEDLGRHSLHHPPPPRACDFYVGCNSTACNRAPKPCSAMTGRNSFRHNSPDLVCTESRQVVCRGSREYQGLRTSQPAATMAATCWAVSTSGSKDGGGITSPLSMTMRTNASDDPNFSRYFVDMRRAGRYPGRASHQRHGRPSDLPTKADNLARCIPPRGRTP